MNNGIGADLIVRPGNATFLNGVSGAPMSVKLAAVFSKLPHVTVASPVITNLSMTDGLEVLWGIDYPSYSRLSPFVFLSGGPVKGPYDVIVDDVYAKTGKGHKAGDTIDIYKHPFRAWQGRAQTDPHRHAGRADGLGGQGLGLLFESRQSRER
jgi:putative ABC transport system permease protein